MCADSRSGDDLGIARLPWPNVVPGDLLELGSRDIARVVDVVYASADVPGGALVEVAQIGWRW